ncbi:MAG: AMP-binding protein [Acidobacteria bacterium]|nr:AMP-binding protein [Acidobacteriota bacterium]
MRTSLVSFVDDCLRRGGETAFAHRRGLRVSRWTYARVAETAFQFARELEARGINKGERVLFWAENSPEWIAALFGCVLRGVIVVPLDVESAPDFVARVRRQTEARLLLVSAQARRDAELDIPSMLLGELDVALARHSTEPLKIEGASDEDLVEIIYTSGTTAEPRGVCLTHRNFLANLAPLEVEMRKYLRWERLVHPLRFLNLLPLSHVFGQFMGIFVPLLIGGEVFFQDSLNPSEIIEQVRRQRVSVVVTVPRLLDTLREHVERGEESRGRGERFRQALAQTKDWHFVRRWWVFRRIHRRFGWKFWAFVAGGATLAEETETFWRRLGFPVLQGYGMTETASLITVNHPFKSARGSVGKILPGQEVRLDEHGEILVRGANVSPGYWKDGVEPLASEEGWLRTGDLGEMDEDGNIHFKGRRKDVIVTAAGLNIYPEDIEAALDRQPEVRASAVVGVEGRHGPEPLAVIIMHDTQADPAPVVERANAALARHQQVLRWLVWPEQDFPRTATHKVRKRDILERIKAEDGRISKATQTDSLIPHPSSLIPSHISSIAARMSGEAHTRLDEGTKLETDLKLDSLGRVELLSSLEDRYQIEIDEAAFTAATTLGDIEEIVRRGGANVPDSASRYPYPEWAQRFPVSWLRVVLFYLVVLPITSMLCWVRVRGERHLDSLRGPVLFVSNHITYIDHALILSALPGRFRRRLAIAQEGERLRWWRRPPVGIAWLKRVRWRVQYALVVTFFNTFSLPQKSGFRRSFDFAGESVDRGYSLLVFPEGARAEHDELNPFMQGTGLLASKLSVPVVPVRIDGLSELKRRGRRIFALPGSVTVMFGEPVIYAPGTEPTHITADLERRVKEIKAEG